MTTELEARAPGSYFWSAAVMSDTAFSLFFLFHRSLYPGFCCFLTLALQTYRSVCALASKRGKIWRRLSINLQFNIFGGIKIASSFCKLHFIKCWTSNLTESLEFHIFSLFFCLVFLGTTNATTFFLQETFVVEQHLILKGLPLDILCTVSSHAHTHTRGSFGA